MKLHTWIHNIFRPQKVIRFKQLSTYALNETTSAAEISRILQQSSNNDQFHIGYEQKSPADEKCGLALIQRDLKDRDHFLVCKTYAFGVSPWKKYHVREVVNLILDTKYSECRKFEKWNLVTRAIEGKSFGEY